MATLATPPAGKGRNNARFFLLMAFAMAITIIAGFSVNLAMGRSSFASPIAYHVHAFIFMGWLALFVGQHVTAAKGNWPLHRSLGNLAYLWIPAMVASGCLIMIVVAQRTGGPFFFAVNEFLISNLALLLCFGGIALWALRRQRYTGWHRRLMLVGMAILTGPGLGRLLPMPLMIPNAWIVTVAATFIFPLIGMAADWRRDGRIHPAYLWGTGIYAGVFALSMLIAYSPLGYAFTDMVVSGTPGAERPMEAFLPAGFSI
tara:strand:- start:659 stop:1435 length:777 start_codon:yes stop_codon:yes gene_type:complete